VIVMSGLEHLSGAALRRAQERTLAAPRMRYSLLARVLFSGMDLVYGRRLTLSKFKVRELIARVPYQAWPLRIAGRPGPSDRIRRARAQGGIPGLMPQPRFA
jgi:hypothetical protein